MTKEKLIELLAVEGVKIKILYFEKMEEETGCEQNYYIVYTRDLNYEPDTLFEKRSYVDPEFEEEIIASDYEEAIMFIKNPVEV